MPTNTPVAIIEMLNKVINAGLADPKMKAHLADLGATALNENDVVRFCPQPPGHREQIEGVGREVPRGLGRAATGQ